MAGGFPDKYTSLWGHTPIGDVVDDDTVLPSGITVDSPLEEAIQWSLENAGGGTTTTVSIDGSGVDLVAALDPDKFYLWNGTNGDASMTPADSTADFQAAFDAISLLHSNSTDDRGGVRAFFPRGRYLITGTVTIPSMTGPGLLQIDMTGVEILHKPQANDIPMFRTTLPTDNNDAEALNDNRDMWTWTGGFYDGDSLPGQVGFELNAVSRFLIQRCVIQAFDEGIVGRFCLHFRAQDMRISQCASYNLRLEEQGNWTGGNAANAASNGTIIENVRFFGTSTQTAQLRIAHSGHIVRDCTFEGGSPAGYNYMFENGNTSVLTSKIENVWLENDPGLGHFYINTYHQFDMDIQYSNTTSVVAVVPSCTLLRIRRVPWPSLTNPGNPRFDVRTIADPTASNVRVWFDGSGVAGEIDVSADGLFAGDVRPISLLGFNWTNQGAPQLTMSGPRATGSAAGAGQIWTLRPPTDQTPALGSTYAAEWVLEYDPDL